MKKSNKQTVIIDPKDKKKTLEQYFRFLELCGLLFDNRKDEVYNVTDIPHSSKFYKIAKDTAKEMNVSWNDMSHEDSNRVMLAMLEDSFSLIREIENSPFINIKTTIQILKTNG